MGGGGRQDHRHPCATCFWLTFKRLYPEVAGDKYDIEVLHTTQVADRLIKKRASSGSKPVNMKVTYHDPCHLGRQGEDHVPWNGKETKIFGQAVVLRPATTPVRPALSALRAAA